jgi:hypothetical protein
VTIALTATADDMLPRLKDLPLGKLDVVASTSY